MNEIVVSTRFPGSELSKTAFRWDQRIFSWVLRIPGRRYLPIAGRDAQPTVENIPRDISQLEALSSSTGGVRVIFSANRFEIWILLSTGISCHRSLVSRTRPRRTSDCAFRYYEPLKRGRSG